MVQRIWISCLVLFVLAVAGHAADKAGSKSAAKNQQPNLEKLKALAGTWVVADKDGKPTDQVVSIIKVTAGGSAVQETLFPGQPQEMVSIYHQDGADLVMTHYCMLGNQPRMKADPKSPPNQIHFEFAGGTNLDPAKDKHMHEGTITFVDADHIEWCGVAWEGGIPVKGHECGMKLVRKK
ncbi:MAG TPA: hypothetical protein VH643_25125 [Gemmataceae bacterium]|jgi:hypothetical protein